MKRFTDLEEWTRLRSGRDWPRVTLGFVPTMGALHAGHAELVRRSRRENDLTAVSVFVNPTQFNDPDDLKRYPRPLEADLELLARERVDYVLLPKPEEMYADGYRYVMTERSEASAALEGAHRPGHFEGMLTVVLKLLNLARPDRAYFGEKDWQQLELVRGMVDALRVPTRIVPVPTVREEDGLAMSSRNRRLSPEERRFAAGFPRALREEPSAAAARARLECEGFRVDYVEDREGRRLGAVHVGAVRLIDNLALPTGDAPAPPMGGGPFAPDTAGYAP